MIKLGVNIPYYENSKEAHELAKKLYLERVHPAFEKNSNIIPFMYFDTKGIGCGTVRNLINEELFKKVDYVIYIDSDDYIDEDYLEKVYNTCQEGYDIIETKFSILGNIVEFKDKLPNHVTGIAYKVDLIKDLKFNENRNIGEDTEYNTYINENKEYTRKCIDTVYYYNLGVNRECLTYRYTSGKLSEFKGGDALEN